MTKLWNLYRMPHRVPVWRHKKINLWNYGIWCHFQVKHPWKRVLAKNNLLIVIPSRNIKDESLILPHINLSNFWAGSKLKEPAPILKGLYGMLATSISYISIGNCNSELIFGMRVSLRIFYKNMALYPIISKKLFLWRHHFGTLFYWLYFHSHWGMSTIWKAFSKRQRGFSNSLQAGKSLLRKLVFKKLSTHKIQIDFFDFAERLTRETEFVVWISGHFRSSARQSIHLLIHF